MFEATAEERVFVERVLKEEFTKTGEVLINVFQPDVEVINKKQSQGLAGLACCLPPLNKSIQWEGEILRNELYGLTSHGIYVVVRKEKLESAAKRLGKKLGSVKEYRKVQWPQLHLLKSEGTRTVPYVALHSEKDVLKLYGHGTLTIVAISESHDAYMSSALLDTLPAGALENRISHN